MIYLLYAREKPYHQSSQDSTQGEELNFFACSPDSTVRFDYQFYQAPIPYFKEMHKIKKPNDGRSASVILLGAYHSGTFSIVSNVLYQVTFSTGKKARRKYTC